MITTSGEQSSHGNVGAGGGAGLPVGVVLVWVLGEAGVMMPPEVGAAIGTIATTVIAYLIRK